VELHRHQHLLLCCAMHPSKLDDGAPGCSRLRKFQSMPAKQHQVRKRFRQAIKALLPSPTCPCPHCHALRSSLHCKPSSICCKATAHEYQTTAKKKASTLPPSNTSCPAAQSRVLICRTRGCTGARCHSHHCVCQHCCCCRMLLGVLLKLLGI
jgi:hypothetical protein